MSQDTSFMFSDAVYLFGKIFSKAPSRDGKRAANYGKLEQLPDGTWVNQINLAVQAVLAALAYLYHKRLIAIDLGERKLLFRKKKTAKVKKLQSTAPDLSGLEAIIFRYILDNSDVYSLTCGLMFSSSNPWREVLAIVKWNLLQKGIVKQVVKETFLFIRTHKYVVNGDISRDISKAAKQITELQKTLKELQSKGELYQQILSDIEEGIASREYTGD